MIEQTMKPETIALHAGYRFDPAAGSVAVPIHQTASYDLKSTEHATKLFNPRNSATSTPGSRIRPARHSNCAWQRSKAALPP